MEYANESAVNKFLVRIFCYLYFTCPTERLSPRRGGRAKYSAWSRERCQRELKLLVGPPKPVKVKDEGRSQEKYLGKGNCDTNSPDTGSSDISSDMMHITVDVRGGSWSHSSRRDHRGFNGCCTAMWKANGKSTTLVLFQDSLFPKVWKRLWTYCKTDYYLKKICYVWGRSFINIMICNFKYFKFTFTYSAQ
jgi:hypothetical protein